MKKSVLLLSFFISCSVIFGQSSHKPPGDGSKDKPYSITSLSHLNWVAANDTVWDKYFEQTSDIDASETKSWASGAGFSPIGNKTKPFSGQYNGLGHIIDSLTINRPDTDSVGLFGYTNNSRIDSVGITNANITGRHSVGILVGASCNSSLILLSYSSGRVSGDENAGGLVGKHRSSTIGYCYSTASVSGNYKFGGLIGDNRSSAVSNCYSTGSVAAGGLGFIGYSYDSEVFDCFFDSETSGQSQGAGTDKTTLEMKSAYTFIDSDWDFAGETENGTNDHWDRSPYYEYPSLSWEHDTVWLQNPQKSGDVYQISSLAHIYWLSHYQNHWDKQYVQTSNINASPTKTWGDSNGFAPIGRLTYISNSYFSGTYDGQGYIIDSLYTDSSHAKYGDEIGFFGVIKNAEISNLGITNIEINPGEYSEDVGGLAGESKRSQIENCFTTGIINGNANYAGGLVGNVSFESIIMNCYSNVKVNGDYRIGGLIGESQATITNCYSKGDVTGGDFVGGLIGYNLSTIKNCYSTGSVIINDGTTGGGLVGSTNDESLTDSSFWDTESSGQTTSAGGIGKTTSEMQDMCTYTDQGEASWDFMNDSSNGTNNYWGLNSGKNDGYPFLEWQNYAHTESCIINKITEKTKTNKQIHIYPNPVDKNLYYESFNNRIISYTIQDLKGKKLIENNEVCENGKIDLSELSTGTYIIRIKTNNDIYTSKIIKY